METPDIAQHGKRGRVGVRELRQNLSVYLARVVRGETLEVTDRGHAVAILSPIAQTASVLDRLRLEGLLKPAKHDLLSIVRPVKLRDRRAASRAVQQQRRDRL